MDNALSIAKENVYPSDFALPCPFLNTCLIFERIVCFLPTAPFLGVVLLELEVGEEGVDPERCDFLGAVGVVGIPEVLLFGGVIGTVRASLLVGVVGGR